MGVSNDPGAYAEFYDILDQAVASERGIQLVFNTEKEARVRNYQFNKARDQDRRRNRAIYASDPTHPMYGRSEYAVLTLRVVKDHDREKWLLLLEKLTIIDFVIEEIPAPVEEDIVEDIS